MLMMDGVGLKRIYCHLGFFHPLFVLSDADTQVLHPSTSP